VVKVIADCLLLKVLQSVELKAPLFVALAVGTFKVITGVVVPLATDELKSVPVVPNVKAATEVTVPPLEGLEFVIVKFGYVPLTEIPVPAVKTTVWSGAVFVIVKVPLLVIGEPETLIPVPPVAATEVTVPVLSSVQEAVIVPESCCVKVNVFVKNRSTNNHIIISTIPIR